MATLIPVLTSSVPNPNVAYNNAWVSIENQSNRPLFAQATYIANASDLSLSLSAASLNVNLQDVENLVTAGNVLIAGSNTLLNDLTGKTVSVNTSALEVLIAGSNTLLNDLTGKTNTVYLETSALTVFGISSSNPAFVYQGDLNYTTDSVSVSVLNVNLETIENLITTSNVLIESSNTYLNDLTALKTTIESSNTYLNDLTGNLNYTTDSVSVSVLNVSVDLINSNFGKNGFTFITSDNGVLNGNFVKVQVLSTCKILSLTATNSEINSLINFELPVDFCFNAPITEIGLEYGAVILYKA